MQKLYNLMKRPVLNSLKPIKFQRLHSKYQFRVEKPFTYPDRRIEIKRTAPADFNHCTVAKMPQLTQVSNSKQLPRDFYYRVLGLTKRATLQQIKTAYYSLAKAFHPDTNRTPQETQRFKDISVAYRVLTDDNRRIEYDQYGLVRDEQEETAYLPPSSQQSINANTEDVENRFKAVTSTKLNHILTNSSGGSINIGSISSNSNSNGNGNGSNIKIDAGNKSERKTFQYAPSTLNTVANGSYNQGESVAQPSDLRNLQNNVEPTIVLSFKEAALGLKRNHDLRFLKICPDCNGKSAKMAQLSNEICRKCFGSGTMTKRLSMHEITVPCDRCHGTKFVNNNACHTCNSRGTLRDNAKIIIDIPPGVENGDCVYADNPATRKRVKFNIQVKESHNFKRRGNDVLTTKYIKVSEAILGCKCQVQGLHETILLQIQPGTESHTEYVMNGKGIKTRDGRIGDHIITVKVVIPKKISTKQRQIILALSRCEEQTVIQATEE